MKYNNTSFNTDACKNMSFTRFEELFSEKLKGHDLAKVFAELGGTVAKKRKREDKESE